MIVFQEEINILRNTTYKHTFYMLDIDGTPLDTSVYTAHLQVVSEVGAYKVLVDLSQFLDTTTYSNSGVIVMVIPYKDTDFSFGRGVFDLKVKNTQTNEVSVIAVGKVTVNDTVTYME